MFHYINNILGNKLSTQESLGDKKNQTNILSIAVITAEFCANESLI